MGQILSPSEVDAILSGLELEPVQATQPPVVSSSESSHQGILYDFAHPEPLRKSHLDVLRLASASAAMTLQTNLSRTLHASFTVNFLGVEQSTYRDYLGTAEFPACIAVFESQGRPGVWLLDVSRPLSFTFIDCLLGGRPFETSSIATPSRSYTDVETRLIERAIRSILPDLAGSFTRRASLSLTRLISESSMISESNSNETVALVTFEVVCDSKQGLIQLCIPWKQIAKPGNIESDEGDDFRCDLRTGAVKIPVVATAQVARFRLSARELASLSPGDVLITDVCSAEEMTLNVDGREIHRGNPGQIQNHKVIRLTVPILSGTAKKGP